MNRFRAVALLFGLSCAATAAAQLEPIAEDGGSVGLALQLRKLSSGTSFLHTAAHPDDEDNGLLVLLSRGRGIRTSLLTATRGDGGQNEIGPELFEAIGILRSEELMAVHRIDGVEQYFTRAYEFGYSFSVEETLQKWGKEEILGDFVRVLRTVRPDVVVSLPPEGEGGGQHHQASAILTREAFRAAADPARFPEQIAEGLRPWQALKLYSRKAVGAGPGREKEKKEDSETLVRIDTGAYDPLLGRTYYQMGSEARSNHKCQGMGQLQAVSGPHESAFRLEDSVLPGKVDRASESDLFDGISGGPRSVEGIQRRFRSSSRRSMHSRTRSTRRTRLRRACAVEDPPSAAARPHSRARAARSTRARRSLPRGEVRARASAPSERRRTSRKPSPSPTASISSRRPIAARSPGARASASRLR